MACSRCAGDEEASHTYSRDDCELAKVAEYSGWDKGEEDDE